jgi:hypothetical protein
MVTGHRLTCLSKVFDFLVGSLPHPRQQPFHSSHQVLESHSWREPLAAFVSSASRSPCVELTTARIQMERLHEALPSFSWRRILALSASLLSSSAFAERRPMTDLLLINGKLTTLDRSNPRADTALIRDGKFMAVGEEGDGLRLLGGMSMSRSTATPRFVDAVLDGRPTAHLARLALVSAYLLGALVCVRGSGLGRLWREKRPKVSGVSK